MASTKRVFTEISGLPADLSKRTADQNVGISQLNKRCMDCYGHVEFSLDTPQIANEKSPLLPQLLLPPSNDSSTTSIYNRKLLGPKKIESPNLFRDFVDIVKPIDPKQAGRRSKYDPKTIARDVLAAAGSDPDVPGLNAHLRIIQSQFTYVDNNSDLSTFRWDLVDPGSNFVEVPPTMERPKNRAKPSRGGLAPKGIMRGNSLFDSESDKSGNHRPARPSGLRHASTPASDSPGPSALSVQIPSPFPIQQPIFPGPDSEGGSSTPRRGRPPKSLTTPSVDTPALPKKRGRPFKISQDDTQSDDPTPKRRGRPFSKPLQEDAPSTDAPKKRGRPFKVPQSIADLQVPVAEPKFNVFRCEWSGCLAELINLDILRIHVLKVHGKKSASGFYTCLWGKCATKHEATDEEIQAKEMVSCKTEFKTKKEWKDHIEEAHMVPQAWFMGDGPKASSLGMQTISLCP